MCSQCTPCEISVTPTGMLSRFQPAWAGSAAPVASAPASAGRKFFVLTIDPITSSSKPVRLLRRAAASRSACRRGSRGAGAGRGAPPPSAAGRPRRPGRATRSSSRLGCQPRATAPAAPAPSAAGTRPCRSPAGSRVTTRTSVSVRVMVCVQRPRRIEQRSAQGQHRHLEPGEGQHRPQLPWPRTSPRSRTSRRTRTRRTSPPGGASASSSG
jgi:hypothetical protein